MWKQKMKLQTKVTKILAFIIAHVFVFNGDFFFIASSYIVTIYSNRLLLSINLKDML